MRGLAQRGTGFLLIALLALGCGATGGARTRGEDAVRRRPRVLLDWRVENRLAGDERLQVLSNGKARYAFRPPVRFRDALRAQASLTSDRFRRTRVTLRESNVCSLRSAAPARSDEPRATLRLDLPGMRCTVRLTDAEWRLDDRARDVVASLDAMKRWMQE